MRQEHQPSWLSEALVWDAHGCLPLRPGADLSALDRYRNSGFHFVSINIGMDFNTLPEIMATLAWMRSWILSHEAYLLAERPEDIQRAKREGKLAIAFDVEGLLAFGGNPLLIDLFHALGVRQMLLAYNNDNDCAGGCLGQNQGLSQIGKSMVARIHQCGVMLDLSHISERAALEAMALSDKPIVFSHSNPAALVAHPRNISDRLIRACAEKQGVVGINGVQRFLGGSTSGECFAQHVDYVVQLVGWQHVGLGIDYVFDQDELFDFMKSHPRMFPTPRFNKVPYTSPEQLTEIVACFLKWNYSELAIRGILGENFLRVASAVWQ